MTVEHGYKEVFFDIRQKKCYEYLNIRQKKCSERLDIRQKKCIIWNGCWG